MPPKLVPLPVAAFVLSSSVAQVLAMVDDGQLLHVFDFASRGSLRRELRFTTEELVNSKAVANLSLNQLLAQLLPNRTRFRSGELTQMLSLSFQHLHTLKFSGDLPARTEPSNSPAGRVTWVQSEDIRRFLADRWLGSPVNPARPATASRSPCAYSSSATSTYSRRSLATR